MTPLRLTVLGSGTIIPDAARGATSLLVEAGRAALMIDCGPGALQALESRGRSFRDIERILLTHFHPDHTLDLGRLFSASANDPAAAPRRVLTLFGPPGLARFIEGWNALYRDIVPPDGRLELREVRPGERLEPGGVPVAAGPAEHCGRQALSWRIGPPGGDIVYTGDTSYCAALADFAGGARLLVSECSFPDGSPVEGHMTPSQVGRLAREARVGEVLLVHLYPVFTEADPAAAVRAIFAGTVTTAHDGMVLETGPGAAT
jgi:ribonuclease BN (tRNA processing enzyme)